MSKSNRHPTEVRERAVRMLREHRHEYQSTWAAITSIAEKIGCTPETLRRRSNQAEADAGECNGITSAERERLRNLEKENRELKRANEILRKASAYFVGAALRQAELDRR